ncbi:MAG: TrkA family potassium uptake protein [Lachnospiraceae bacterium]|nr:TrkA family potassium uptake protein [Lachnospiraceae bacterium]
MKSVLIIGMGRFGHHLCNDLINLGNEVMIMDNNQEVMEDLLSTVTSAKIGDCTKVEVLKSLGVNNFDVCFVCIGTNFQSSLEITSLLKELGAKYVVSKATRDIHAKFLLRNGADEVIYPDRDIAEKVAVKFSANNVFDYIELTDDYSIYEIPTLKEWIGKSIMEVNFRAKYNASIIGIKVGEETKLLPDAKHIFTEEEHLMVIGSNEDMEGLLKKL